MKNTIKQMAIVTFAVLVTVGVAHAAVPIVSQVEMTQRESTRIVEITYDLIGEAAIVTLGIETNGVALPDNAVTRLSGDVSTLVNTGEDKTIIWNAGADWPENLTESAKAKITAWSTNAPPQVMVIDLSKGMTATANDPYPVYYYPSLDALPGGGLSNDVYKTEMLVMNKIPMGTYSMGVEASEGPSVSVTLTKDFYSSVYQVTQKQWHKVMATDPSQFINPVSPAEKVSYNDIRGAFVGAGWPANSHVDSESFIGRIRDKTGLSTFDLPTDAQWEYACRANTISYYNDGIIPTSDAASSLKKLAWFSYNSISSAFPDGSSHPVGQKTPNAWGLYDMHGNVWEWCLDWYADSLVGGTDPKGPTEPGSRRVMRGGGWNTSFVDCRSASRKSDVPSNRL